MQVFSDQRYWLFAFITGTLVQAALFGLLPLLTASRPTLEEQQYITVDFQEWRPPISKPAIKVKKPTIKPKEVVKQKPIIKKKQVIEKKLPVKTIPEKIPEKSMLSEAPIEETIQELESPKATTPEPVYTKPELDADHIEVLPTPIPIFKLSSMPTIAHEVIPQYPSDMRSLGIEGTVKVEILIDRNGKVRKIVVTSSSNKAFNEPVMEALKQTTYFPGNIDGRPVAVRLRRSINFKLK